MQHSVMPHLPPGPPRVKSNPISLALYARSVGRDLLEFQRGRFDKYGDTYTSHVGSLVTLITRHPDLIQQVLVDDGASYGKPKTGIGAAQLRRFLGNGLVSSNGDFWRSQRRQVQPAFDGSHLRAYADTIVEYTRQHVGAWSPGSRVDASSEMMGLTLRIVGKVLMGKDVRSTQGDVASAMRAFRDSFGGFSAVLPKWLPYPPRNREDAAVAAMHALMDAFIDEHAAGNADDEHCLLAVLTRGLDQEGAMTREQLRDEALTLFFAGHETTSHALSWTLSLLSRNPTERARVVEEVRRVLGDRPATFADVPRLEYVQQALSEGMRIYPPVHSVAREAFRDTKLGPYDVPAGAHVVAGIYHAHNDARWHPDPEQFRPERFAAESAKAMRPGSYLPFGAGTRTCIGKRFALMEATLILATLSQRCVLDQVDSSLPEYDAAITLAPRRGIAMRVGSPS